MARELIIGRFHVLFAIYVHTFVIPLKKEKEKKISKIKRVKMQIFNVRMSF